MLKYNQFDYPTIYFINISISRQTFKKWTVHFNLPGFPLRHLIDEHTLLYYMRIKLISVEHHLNTWMHHPVKSIVRVD